MKPLFRSKRNLAVLFAILTLSGYIAFLVLHNYQSQVDLNQSALTRLQSDARSRAVSVSHFFAERVDDIHDLAASRELLVYFASKALGMSMTYGLRTSLVAIEQLFGRLIQDKRIAGSEIYQRIVLIDVNDGPVVDSTTGGALQTPLDEWREFAVPGTAKPSIVVRGAHDDQQIVLSVPYIHKGEYAGLILAWIDRGDLNHLLFGSDAAESERRLCLTTADALIQPRAGDAATASCASVADLFELGTEKPLPRPVRLDNSGVSDGLVVKVPIPNTPFLLVSIADAGRVLGRVAPATLLVTMGLLAFALMLVVGIALWSSLQNRLLRLSFEEAQRQRESLHDKNTQLQVEIAKRRETERHLLEATEAKSLFLATMSHEIRTPINGVMGMTELLLGSGLSGKQHRLAESAHRSVLNLLTLINDILDFSRIEAGRLELEPVAFDLQDVSNDVIRLLAGAAGNKGVALTARLTESVPRHLIGDAARLRQILLNLTGNAVKFTKRGRVEIVFDTETGQSKGILLRCAVHDTGIGIAADVLEGIFDSFSQADNSTTRRFGGSGLGLAITRNLVRLMGGEIEVRSAPGVGSTFTFTVRFEVNTDEEAVSAMQPPSTDTDTLFSGRILVAEDNRANQEVVRGMLEILGCEVVLVSDGQAACQVALDNTFDLVLMDCHMPGLDGFDAARCIREKEDGLGRVPIMALTADVQKDTRGRCLAAGMDDYLSKPFTLQKLRDALKAWLSVSADKPPMIPLELSPIGEFDDALDPEVLAGIQALQRPGRPPVLERVIAAYLESAPPLRDGIHAAVADGDEKALRDMAHALKSSSANLGAKALSELCRQLEAAGCENRLGEAEALLGQMDAVYSTTLNALRGRLTA